MPLIYTSQLGGKKSFKRIVRVYDTSMPMSLPQQRDEAPGKKRRHVLVTGESPRCAGLFKWSCLYEMLARGQTVL